MKFTFFKVWCYSENCFAHFSNHSFHRLPPAPEATPLRSECLLDLNARQRGVDANAKSAGNAERLQLSATSLHHREVVSGGSHHAFLRPADGCADADAPLAGPHPSDACRPPSAPCSVGTGPTRWTAISTWQYPDGHAPPTNGTTSASRRPPRMGTRWPIPLLSTGKPLRGATPTHHHHHCVSIMISVKNYGEKTKSDFPPWFVSMELVAILHFRELTKVGYNFKTASST